MPHYYQRDLNWCHSKLHFATLWGFNGMLFSYQSLPVSGIACLLPADKHIFFNLKFHILKTTSAVYT